MDAPNEVALCYVSKEANLRNFFRCFLIVHLATNSYMDGYLGFVLQKPSRFFIPYR